MKATPKGIATNKGNMEACVAISASQLPYLGYVEGAVLFINAYGDRDHEDKRRETNHYGREDKRLR
jgi:hypothetical protein